MFVKKTTLAKKKFEKFKDRFNSKIIESIPHWIKPNHLTIFRVFLLVPLTYLLIKEYHLLSLILFILALITDSVDGSLARLRKQKTKAGMVLDPIADHLLFIITVLILGGQFYPEKTVIYLAVALEFSMIAVLFRPLLEKASGRKISLEANIFGKLKMILQGLAMIIILINQSPFTSYLSMIILWLAVVAMILNIIKVIATKKTANP